MKRAIIVFFGVLGACASRQTSGPVVVAVKPGPAMTSAEQCEEAGRLREQGYAYLSQLKLGAARSSYLKSLDLDPGNRGALHQLSVIDALAEDRQVGTSSANDHLYGTQISPCERYSQDKLAQDRPPLGNVAQPSVQQNGQIVSYAKGTAQPSELLSPRDIQDTMGDAMRDITRCYKRGVDKNPSLRGEAVVQVSVTPAGEVEEVQLQNNTLFEQGVETCVANVVGGMHFPKRKSKVIMNVLYPLIFGSSDDAAVDADMKTRAAR
jgi:hypothetical protein